MVQNAYRLKDPKNAMMAFEPTHSRRGIIHRRVVKAMECGFRLVGFQLAATFYNLVAYALCYGEWSNRHFCKPYKNRSEDEGICRQPEVFDPARYGQHIIPKNVVLNLYFIVRTKVLSMQ
ncbi:hypothetical protein B9Z19DRAFT_1069311 [Tuber borchii]|uniref:Uncharacterized protein n=1 Tax=Tuber borchii TaxID=42251 RepID=A0A2T6ZC06_TUBBO|nr:hypothetical protein B9Z19DRAFT_1069311 [Tuber borchii]